MFPSVRNLRCHVAGEVFAPAASPAPPILLLHGAGNDCNAWNEVRQGLAALGHTALAPDLPGHGRSEGIPPASIADSADWLLALVAALDFPRVVLAGHSMGSLIALAATAREPSRVAALALIGSSLPMPVSGTLLEMAEKDPDQAFRIIALWSHTPAFYLSGGKVGHGIWGPGRTLAIMRRNRPGALAVDMRSCHAYQNGEADAGAVRCPALLIVGRRDRMTPARNAAPLAEALRNSPQVEIETIENCGHAIMAEHAPAVVAALHRLVTRHPLSP
ncbi:MAG: alpha/beta hydrolase [Betaproteobacteria bacterium]|nr:alpha/beta hydrolase [Betaproteobacteria bacterium]